MNYCQLVKSSIFLIINIIMVLLNHATAERIEILMSNVTTQKDDAYICTSYKLNEDHQYITNIEPLATANIVHHMFAFGCEKPASSSNSWNCESLVCQGSKTILFAWGRNAPALQLPDDVAFKVGPKTSFKYIVVNVHYLIKVNNDKSGLAMTVGERPRKYEAGIMLLVPNYIGIPPNTKKYSTKLSCKYTGKTLNVFAYRVHAHVHGDVNTAYRIRDHEWVKLAKGDPQWPQAFYPTETVYDLKDGDSLIGTCTYHNDENRYVYAGSTHTDEMCNIYLMYYTDRIEDVQNTCSGSAYPQLEAIIPDEAYVKPPIPSNLNGINDNIDSKNANSHHDMEGSKLHHDVASNVSKYTYASDWYDAKAANLGQIGGIELNQKTDTIVIFHRGSQIWQSDSFNDEFRFNTRKYSIIPEDTIVTLNKNTGKVINSWGAKQFFLPHGLTIDCDGNIWVTDVGRHQVLKFEPNKKEPVLEIGERMVPGNDKKHFCQPADVAVLKNGEFFVADGYCNSRIVKFSKTGEYLTEWSSEDEKMPAHFFLPHSLALNEANNLLCVADRENYRVQCFDLNGNFLQQYLTNDYGPIYSVAFASNNASILYAVNGYSSRVDTQYDKKIFLLSTQNGNLLGSINLLPDIRTPHDLALSDDASEIYIANLNPPAIFKYVLINYNVNTQQDKRKLNNQAAKKDSIDGDKENFRTSMFIMAFLGIPLLLVIIISTIVRLKNMGKLKRLKINALGSGLDSKQKEIGRWISEKSNKRNGFTRLNQESDNEEAESLTKKTRNSSSNRENSDYESESEVEIQAIPTLSKA